MRIILPIIFLAALIANTALAQTQGSAIHYLFEYNLPIREQTGAMLKTRYEICKVKSFIYEGKLRYYQTELSLPGRQFPSIDSYPLMASANTERGTFSSSMFAYEDEMPDVLDGVLVNVKVRTQYSLDPRTLKVITAELQATGPNGQVLYRYVCGEVPTS